MSCSLIDGSIHKFMTRPCLVGKPFLRNDHVLMKLPCPGVCSILYFSASLNTQSHRMGQKKDVKVAYLDTSYTIDVIMRLANDLKENNAEVILADGTALGSRSDISYSELHGIIGQNLKAIISMRNALISQNIANGDADAPLVAGTSFSSDLEATIARAVQTKAAVKSEDALGSDDDDSQSVGSSPSGADSLLDVKMPHATPLATGMTDGDADDEDSDDEMFRLEIPGAKPAAKSSDGNRDGISLERSESASAGRGGVSFPPGASVSSGGLKSTSMQPPPPAATVPGVLQRWAASAIRMISGVGGGLPSENASPPAAVKNEEVPSAAANQQAGAKSNENEIIELSSDEEAGEDGLTEAEQKELERLLEKQRGGKKEG